jgi:hypothetical protein
MPSAQDSPTSRRSPWPLVRFAVLAAIMVGVGWKKAADDMKGRAAAMGWHCEEAVEDERTAEQLKEIRERLDRKSE